MGISNIVGSFNDGYRNIDSRHYTGMLRTNGVHDVVNTVSGFNKFDSNYPSGTARKIAYLAGEGAALLSRQDSRIYTNPRVEI